MRRHFFEGVALDRRPRGFAFVVAYLGFVVGNVVVGDEGEADARHTAMALTVTIVAGGLWQLLSRRDVAERLLFLSLLVALTAVIQFLPRAHSEPNGWPYLGIAGLVTGLVLTELTWRRVEARAPESVSAAP